MMPKDDDQTIPAFDLVIFDLDGTLVDSIPDIARSLNAVRAELNLPPLPVEAVTRFVGDGAAKLIERSIPTSATQADPASLVQRYVRHYAEHVCVDSRLFPGVADLLERLSRAAIAMAVITNKPHELAREVLSALSIARYFLIVIGDGDRFPRKPDPKAARQVIANAGTDPRRTIVVGDGLPDIRMAHAVPCASVAAAWGYVPLPALAAESPTYMAATPADAARVLLRAGPPTVTPER